MSIDRLDQIVLPLVHQTREFIFQWYFLFSTRLLRESVIDL
jgi:hypothetical protein